MFTESEVTQKNTDSSLSALNDKEGRFASVRCKKAKEWIATPEVAGTRAQ